MYAVMFDPEADPMDRVEFAPPKNGVLENGERASAELDQQGD
jgi:hypothetical protein